MPDSLRASLNVPKFDKAVLPSKSDIDDITSWMVEKLQRPTYPLLKKDAVEEFCEQ